MPNIADDVKNPIGNIYDASYDHGMDDSMMLLARYMFMNKHLEELICNPTNTVSIRCDLLNVYVSVTREIIPDGETEPITEEVYSVEIPVKKVKPNPISVKI